MVTSKDNGTSDASLKTHDARGTNFAGNDPHSFVSNAYGADHRGSTAARRLSSTLTLTPHPPSPLPFLHSRRPQAFHQTKMMFRAMLVFALGLHTAGAFQAPGLAAGRSRTTPLKSWSAGSADHTLGTVGRQTSQPQPSRRAQQLINRVRVPSRVVRRRRRSCPLGLSGPAIGRIRAAVALL